MKRTVFVITFSLLALYMALTYKPSSVTNNPTPVTQPMDSHSVTTTAVPPTTAPRSAPTSWRITTTIPPVTTSTAPHGASGTTTGPSVSTKYGPVQVSVTRSDGKLTAVKATAYPSRSEEDKAINGEAIPKLEAEALRKQSADLSIVSGATFTSKAFAQSLQGALAN